MSKADFDSCMLYNLDRSIRSELRIHAAVAEKYYRLPFESNSGLSFLQRNNPLLVINHVYQLKKTSKHAITVLTIAICCPMIAPPLVST